MKDLLEALKKQLAKEETKRFLRFMMLPLVVVILIMIIVIADKPAGQGGETGEVSTLEEDQTGEGQTMEGQETGEGGETSESQPEKAEYVLSETVIPEITELMERYLRARKSCDREELSAVYGGTISGEDLDTLMGRLEEEVKFYQDFQNIVCRAAEVPGNGGFVVYTGFDVKFRQADTLAPSLAACYVKQAADGTYYIEGAMSEEETAVTEEVNHTAAVQALAKEVNGALRTALGADENLLAVYNTLTGKEPSYTEGSTGGSQEETETPQVQIADTPETPTESGTSAEAGQTAAADTSAEPE